jgi:hypothetical protein
MPHAHLLGRGLGMEIDNRRLHHPAQRMRFSTVSSAENGSSKGRFMNTWPSACVTSTLRPCVASNTRKPRPGATLEKFSGRTIRGSCSMKLSMSFWSKAWSPSVRQSAPAASSSLAWSPVIPAPWLAFSPLTTTKSSPQACPKPRQPLDHRRPA